MNVTSWSSSAEVKELLCGNKMVVTQCVTMGCQWYCEVYAVA